MNEDVRQLAFDIGGQSLVDDIAGHLEENNLDQARMRMLGFLDGWVMGNNPPPAERAKGFYDRLGFSTEERLAVRQRNLKQ